MGDATTSNAPEKEEVHEVALGPILHTDGAGQKNVKIRADYNHRKTPMTSAFTPIYTRVYSDPRVAHDHTIQPTANNNPRTANCS